MAFLTSRVRETYQRVKTNQKKETVYLVWVFWKQFKGQKDSSEYNRGWAKKKYTDGLRSGGNILGQSALKC